MWFQMQPMVQYNQVLSLACQNGHVALNEDAIICFVHNIEIIKKTFDKTFYELLVVLANTNITIFKIRDVNKPLGVQKNHNKFLECLHTLGE